MEGEAVVRQQLINVLGNRPHESVFTIDLCRALRQPKKVVNRVLYRLQREGLVHKVVESPPAWKLVNGDWKRPISLSPHSSSSKFVNGVSPSSEKSNKEPCSEEEGQERQEGTQLGVQMIMDAKSPSAATAQNGVNPTALQNGTGVVSPAEAADTPTGKGPPATPKTDTVCIEEQINAITEKIISYLKSVNSPVFTTDLAKAVGLRSKKEINPILYRLQEQGLVKKENDIPPLWRAVESATSKVSHMSPPLSASDSVVRTLNEIPAEDLEKKILSVLSNSGKAFMNALEIAKAIGLSSKREVNPALYRLLKQGRVRKVSDLPPMWAPGVSMAGTGRGENKASTPLAPQELAKLDASFQKLQTKEDKLVCDDPATKGANGDAQQSPRSKDSKTSAQQSASSSSSSGVNSCSGSSSTSSDASDKSSTSGVSASSAKNDASTTEEEKNAVVAANNQGTSHPPGKQGMTGVKRVLNSSSFAALMKNPVSAFHEYGQMHHIEAKIDIVGSDGPLHNPRFKAAAVLGNEVVGTAWAKSKKEAKRQAAELAIRSLVAQNDLVMNDSTPSEADVLAELGTNCPIFDTIAALSHVAFNKAVLCVPEYVGGRKVLAALVMKKNADDVGTVICFGTGNRCISGERMSQEGTVVNDSHAEVITRRSFLRYLYQQLLEYQPDVEHPLFEPCEDGSKLRIRENVTFHLYISTAPCGDAALFSHHCKGGPNEDTHEKGDNSHTPLYANSLQGLLRTKMEAGEGTIPVEEEFQYQTWDAIMRGERLRTMSCSDKIARWNVVGLQGALLSHFMKPIYLDSVTLGNLYHHGHLSRAVCCRLENDPSLDSLLPADYRLNHPRLGHVSVYKPPRETEKTKPYSINWCLGDERPELTNGVTGLCDERVESQRHSRVSKVVLFESFKKVCKQFGRNDLLGKAYGETKHVAQYHQRAKEVLFKRFQDRGWGTWIRKPPEEEMFH